MSAAAFNIRWDRAQAAKDSLCIVGEVGIMLVDSWNPAYAWCDEDDDGNLMVVMRRDLHPEFASFCLWHELKHIEQAEKDYAGSWDDFLWDYEQGAKSLDIGISGGMLDFEIDAEGNPLEIEDAKLRLTSYAMLPWEADANLGAWENRMTLLTKRGRGKHTYGYQGSWWFFQALGLDLGSIMEVGHEYRQEMRA